MECNPKYKVALILAFLTIFIPKHTIHITGAEDALAGEKQIPHILLAVAKCESGGRQFYQNGEIVKNYNTNGTTDYGKFQINSIHLKTAEKLGIDVMTEKGNIEYALYLYEKNGLRDWNASAKCWKQI